MGNSGLVDLARQYSDPAYQAPRFFLRMRIAGDSDQLFNLFQFNVIGQLLCQSEFAIDFLQENAFFVRTADWQVKYRENGFLLE
jgi:hypothetical protein